MSRFQATSSNYQLTIGAWHSHSVCKKKQAHVQDIQCQDIELPQQYESLYHVASLNLVVERQGGESSCRSRFWNKDCQHTTDLVTLPLRSSNHNDTCTQAALASTAKKLQQWEVVVSIFSMRSALRPLNSVILMFSYFECWAYRWWSGPIAGQLSALRPLTSSENFTCWRSDSTSGPIQHCAHVHFMALHGTSWHFMALHGTSCQCASQGDFNDFNVFLF